MAAGAGKGEVSRARENPQRLYEMFLDIFFAGCVAEEGLRQIFLNVGSISRHTEYCVSGY